MSTTQVKYDSDRPKTQQCPLCGGFGPGDCPECDGDGRIPGEDPSREAPL